MPGSGKKISRIREKHLFGLIVQKPLGEFFLSTGKFASSSSVNIMEETWWSDNVYFGPPSNLQFSPPKTNDGFPDLGYVPDPGYSLTG